MKLQGYENGFFIECGANDGVDQSNTWHYEKYLNWKGILIEPLPNKFFELRRNRDINNHYFNVALVDNKFKEEIVELIDTGLTSTFKILNNKDHSLSVQLSLSGLSFLVTNTVTKEIDFFSEKTFI